MAIVATCPSCGESVLETHENYGCPKCGQPLPEDIRRRLPAFGGSGAFIDARPSDSAPTPTLSSSPVVNRYRDAYRVANTLVGLGNGLKILGPCLAGAIIFLSMLMVSKLGAAALVAVIPAGITGVLFWIGGVIVAAQGQLVLATLDTAVASSPFLNDSERADVMGLPPIISSS